MATLETLGVHRKDGNKVKSVAFGRKRGMFDRSLARAVDSQLRRIERPDSDGYWSCSRSIRSETHSRTVNTTSR